MKIINIGILAHVDAGKTTLTESLLYASGAISEPGSVEKGTTRTDTMFLERQRGITIQAAVTSFQWHRCKVNIVDTPGHMDFLAEVYRSLAVLDGAILVISAKDGVQAQTRILFHALRKMNIPTVIFINKIDQAGVDLQSVVQSVRDKLSADIIIKQTVSLSPEIVLEENTDIEAWDAVIENNDELLEKYIAGEPISREKLAREEQQRVQDASLFPVYHGSAKNGLGIQPLMDAVTGLFQPIGEQGGAALCGSVFKVEYTDCGQRRVYLRLYSGTLRLRDTVALAGREKLKITEMRIPSKGEIVRTDTAYQGEIVILPSDSVRLLADRAYGAQAIREYISERGASYVIPPQKNVSQPWPVDWHVYKERHLIECFFQKIKWFRRVATRYDKLDASFLAFVYLAAIAILLF